MTGLKHLKPEVVEQIAVLADQAYPPKKPTPNIHGTGVTKLISRTLADVVPKPMDRELCDAIQSLTQEQQFELQALMWYGRSKFSGEFSNFKSAMAHSKDSGFSDATVRYVAGKTPLAQYLRDGLARLAEQKSVKKIKGELYAITLGDHGFMEYVGKVVAEQPGILHIDCYDAFSLIALGMFDNNGDIRKVPREKCTLYSSLDEMVPRINEENARSAEYRKHETVRQDNDYSAEERGMLQFADVP